jgi:osmotically-inducible protein OsmY
MERGAERAGDAIGDAAITASVNAELARDNELSALGINVDTANGRVTLSGNAPNEAARERATQLASAVRGVTSVDNELRVEASGEARPAQ